MSRPTKAAGAMPAPVRKLRCADLHAKIDRRGTRPGVQFARRPTRRLRSVRREPARRGLDPFADRYDDGGFSGATLERPALRRLLADIEAGRVDIIVTYKLDRLSRSLTDFVKLIELFDSHNVTFVSVTQSFNTTTSMGRLTLNILLSFAQFEREVIGERIRDKFARARGRAAFGWAARCRLDIRFAIASSLINETEAARVRRVFALFAETGSGAETVRRLRAEGVTGKTGRLLEKGDSTSCSTTAPTAGRPCIRVGLTRASMRRSFHPRSGTGCTPFCRRARVPAPTATGARVRPCCAA